MPIFVTNYHWDQSSENIYLRVELQGAKKSSVSVLQSENYIKVSFPPYICEKPLWGKIDPDKTLVTIENGSVGVRLQKAEAKEWIALSVDLPFDKTEARDFMAKLRQDAVKFSQKDAEKKREEKAADKNKKDRFAVSQQIKLEQDEKKRIEDFKNEEKKRMTDEILEFQKSTESENSEQSDEIKRQWEHYRKLEAELENIDSDEDETKVLEETKSTLKSASNEGKNKKAEKTEIEEKPKHKTVIENYLKQKQQIFDNSEISQPAIRGAGKNIEISFTPRVFPTPLRESRKPEEDEWLRKQNEARKRADDFSDELSDIEKDPVLLRQKGNSFFQKGNYQGAANVFTHAIKLYPKMPELYSNRAACHLKLRNFFKALDDSSKAIDLLVPACEANAKDRTKAYLRRGAAFCELECYAEGLIEYEAALKCNPTNEQIYKDCQNLRKYIEGTYTGALRMENPYENENNIKSILAPIGQKTKTKSGSQNKDEDEVDDNGDDETASETSDDDDEGDDDVIHDIENHVTKKPLVDKEDSNENLKATVTNCEDNEEPDSDDVDE